MVAAVLTTMAATVALPAAPAQAAPCSGAGVSVLIDFGDLGGGESTGCGSGSKASEAFASAGYALTQHPQQRGFVCKVEGKPAHGDCLATNAYWAFFVSDDGGPWVYASLGVYEQPVDAGDSVALVWQSSSSRRQPASGPWQQQAAAPTSAPPPATTQPVTTSTSAAASTKQPSKTAKPTRKPTKQGTSQGTVAKPTPTVSALSTPASSGAATPTAASTEGGSETPSSAAPTPTTTAAMTAGPTAAPTAPSSSATVSEALAPEQPTADDSGNTGGGLPGWVAPVVVVVLLLGAGGVAVARRQR